MHFIFSKTSGSSVSCRKFPNRRTDNILTFLAAGYRLRKTGTVQRNEADCSRQCCARIITVVEEDILNVVGSNPRINTWVISAFHLPQPSVWTLQYERLIHRYRSQRAQASQPEDLHWQQEFSSQPLQQRTDQLFWVCILFAAEELLAAVIKFIVTDMFGPAKIQTQSFLRPIKNVTRLTCRPLLSAMGQ